MKRRKGIRFISAMVCVAMMAGPASYAAEAVKETETTRAVKKYKKLERLTVTEAVGYAFDHSDVFDKIENQIDIANVLVDNAKFNGDKLEDAVDDLKDGSAKIVLGEKGIEDMKVALALGIAPADITITEAMVTGKLTDAEINGLKAQGLLPISFAKGKKFEDVIYDIIFPHQVALNIVIPGVSQDDTLTLVKVLLEQDAATINGLDDATSMAMFQMPAANVKGLYGGAVAIDAGARTGAKSFADKIIPMVSDMASSKAETALAEGKVAFEKGNAEYLIAMASATDKIDRKIGYSSSIQYEGLDAKEMMIKMADVNLNVSNYARKVYKNQIAMLIKKNYYDALYAKRIVGLKEIAMERGKTQYEMVQLSYDNGMKSKDDLLLAKMYYDGTVMAHRLAEAEYNNAIIEIKKNMNMDKDVELKLIDNLFVEVEDEALEPAILSGLTKRIEIKELVGRKEIYGVNERILNEMYFPEEEKFKQKEATLLKEKAEIELEMKKDEIEAEIRKDYELMIAVGDMLETSSDLIKNAQEVAEISKLKYEQGFGVENSLMKSMGLESSSGTILELIAAQETLSDMEAKVAQLRYNYTMAKIKFENDAVLLEY